VSNAGLVPEIYNCVPVGGNLFLKHHEAASNGLPKSEDLIITNLQIYSKYLNTFQMEKLKIVTGANIASSAIASSLNIFS